MVAEGRDAGAVRDEDETWFHQSEAWLYEGEADGGDRYHRGGDDSGGAGWYQDEEGYYYYEDEDGYYYYDEDHEGEDGELWDGDQTRQGSANWLAGHYQLSARVAAAMVGLVALAAFLGYRAASEGGQVAAVDPDTGLPWCQDPASDAADGSGGDGYGIEEGLVCRLDPSQLLAASAVGTGDPAAADGTELSAGGTQAAAEEASPPTAGAGQAAIDGEAAEEPSEGMVVNADYESNLAMIRAQAVRNTTQDDSPYLQTPSAELVPENHYGPRQDYLGNPGGNPEQSFPVSGAGQFRTGCEFSHFSYDDPIVYPNQPGASHLHMYFGNTDANAFSTAETLLDSGGGTCNGGELNRTGYWAPAMFDGDGNVRIPERIVVYYKGIGQANGNAELFPDGAAIIATVNLNTVDAGGAQGIFTFVCSDNFSTPSDHQSNTMPDCDGSAVGNGDSHRVVLEMNVKFPQCWNGQDPSDPRNFRHPANGSWYGSVCNGEFDHTLVNLEYFINYPLEPGESTGDWFLSSDIDPKTLTRTVEAGSTTHADWWSGWHEPTNQMWLDNCVNRQSPSTAQGCGFGYLTDGGPDGDNPLPGPALQYREQYTGPIEVPAAELYQELCPGGGSLPSAAAAAYCNPAAGSSVRVTDAAAAGG